MTYSLDSWLIELQQDLRTHFKPVLLGRAKTVFGFEFDQGSPFHLIVDNDNFSFNSGLHDAPTVTLYVSDHQTLKELLTGNADGMEVFMENRYRADGNIVLSQLLLYLFKPDRPTIAYEVKD